MSQRLYIDNGDGFGPRDFTKFLYEADQFTQQRKNEPTLFDFKVVPVSGLTGWVVPERGAYVRFEDDRWVSRDSGVPASVIFTGFITDDPELQFLGLKNGVEFWAYSVKCTSDEYLLNTKQVPAMTFINRSRGYILRSLIEEMCRESTEAIYNVDGILDGGTERIYQTDPSKKWSEIASEFAKSDGFTYWAVNRHIFYQPEGHQSTSNNPQHALVVDKADPRYNPDNVQLACVAADIVNDLTVFGDNEPTTIAQEHWISDGYTGDHPLACMPYGVEETQIIDDDFTSVIDTSTWQEEDDDQANYIQPFEGALNITGGPGEPAAPETPATAYLRSRKGIELSGVVECRDGEIYFPPNPTGWGLLGGMHTNEVPSQSNMWCGWRLYCSENATYCPSGAAIFPVGPTGIETASGFPLNVEHSYVLRKIIEVVRRPIPGARRRTANGYVVEYTSQSIAVGAFVTWMIEEINADDPSAVVKTQNVILRKYYAGAPPEFVLYSVVVPYTCHLVMNNVMVKRPQQVTVLVNGSPVLVGSYMDGGRCSIVADGDKRAKLAWYAISGTSTINTSYRDAVFDDRPQAYYRCNEQTGNTVYDATGNSHAGNFSSTAVPGVRVGLQIGITGLLQDDIDTCYQFNGSDGWAEIPSGIVLPTDWLMLETLVRTSDTRANNPIASTPSHVLNTVNGYLHIQDGAFNLTGPFIADGFKHHIAWTYVSGTHYLYVDGQVRAQQAGAHTAHTGALHIGHAYGGTTVFNGYIDEVALYAPHAGEANPPQLTAERIRIHHGRSIQSLPEIVTIPPQGARVDVSYYRRDKSRARLRSLTSIATERAKYHDDGVRQRVLTSSDVTPSPRTSEECLLVARAYMADVLDTRFEGSYKFETVEGQATDLVVWPRPGDVIPCTLDLANGTRITQNLPVTNVTSSFLGKGAYSFDLEFGPVNRFDDAQRVLLLRRKSSSDEPSIADVEIDIDETIDNVSRPGDPLECTVTSITSTQVIVRMTVDNALPTDVVGYEVRTSDSGWGKPNYLARVTAATLTLTRDRRDRTWYIKPYDNAGNYSTRAAMVRVTYPLQNTNVLQDITGDIDKTRVRVEIPIPKDPDFAGVIVRQGSSTGTILYQGDGISTKQAIAKVVVIPENGKIIIDIPNPTEARSYVVWCASYNLLSEFDAGTSVTISKPAPEVTTPTSTNGGSTWNWGGTADSWAVTFQNALGQIQTLNLPGSVTNWTFPGTNVNSQISIVARDDDFDDFDTGGETYGADSDVPSAPTVTVSVKKGDTPGTEGQLAFLVEWTRPEDNYRTITGYQIWVKNNNVWTGTWSGAAVGSQDRQCEFFQSGATRYFRVRAVNEFGEGAWSTAYGPVTTATTLDPIGVGGAWNYSSPYFNPDINIGWTGGGVTYPLWSCVDGAYRSRLGLVEGTGDVWRHLPNRIQRLNVGGVATELLLQGYGLSYLYNGANVETWAGYANSGFDSNGYLKSRVNAGVTMWNGGSWSSPFLYGYHTLDGVNDSGTYSKTTGTEKQGGARAYSGFNGSAQLVTGIYNGSNGYQDSWYLVNAARAAWMALHEYGSNAWRVYDNMVDSLSVVTDGIHGANINYLYRAGNDLRSDVDGFNRSR